MKTHKPVIVVEKNIGAILIRKDDMFVIEVIGLLAKHFALIVRLFANMIAGHIVLFAFLGLIIIFKSYWVSPLSIGFGVFINLLEILVSFIQAYVFTLLSALFIGMAVHPSH